MPRPGEIHVSEPFLPFFAPSIEWPAGYGKLAIAGDLKGLKGRLRAVDLWATDAAAQLNDIPLFRDVSAHLRDVLYGLSERHPGALHPITGKELADLFPWEALASVGDLELPFNPVRSDATARPAASLPDRLLRAVLVVGHEGPERELNIQEEIDIFTASVKDAAQVRDHLETGGLAGTLRLPGSTPNSRAQFFGTHRPDIVIYLGHGKSSPRPSLRIGPGDDDWLGLKELARSATHSDLFPASWIFLACSIGEAPRNEPGPSGPEAFRILSKQGARAMVAMRSRIRPPMARLVGLSILESVVAGAPLELAAADARRAARRSRQSGGTLIDWAAPAVWSTIVGFNPMLGADVAPTLVASKLTRHHAEASGAGLGSPQPWAIETATRWLSQERIVFSISSPDKPTRAELIEIAGAMGRLSARPVLLLDLEGSALTQRLDSRLRDWALKARKALNFVDAETNLGRAIASLADGDLDGLERVLAVEKIAVVISNGPDADDHTAWRILERPAAGRTIAIGRPRDALQSREGWSAEIIDKKDEQAIPAQALATFPKTLAILASQEEALDLKKLEPLTGEPSGQLSTSAFLVRTGAGWVLRASARDKAKKALGTEALAEAHRLMFDARAARAIVSDDELAILRDLIGWGGPNIERLTRAIVSTRRRTWTDADWLRLTKTLEPAEAVWSTLDPALLLHFAALYATRQLIGRARVWLQAAKPADPINRAHKAGIESECFKAEADDPAAREAMMQSARSAVAEIERSDDVRVKEALPTHRANLARLELYFDHNAPAAKDIYSEIIARLDGNSGRDAPLLVACLRNLSECLFEFPPFQAEADLDAAAACLSRAENLARRHQLAPLRAEVHYSAAKLAERRDDPTSARHHLISAVEAAEAGGHVLCARIATMRRFWLDDQLALRADPGALFDYALFTDRLRKLELLEVHAWARRFAMQSRLRAARRLQAAAEAPWAEIKSLLRSNLQAVFNLDEVSSSSDRRNIAVSYAGLAAAAAREAGEDDPDKTWGEFEELAWAADWLKRQPATDRATMWAKG